MTTCYRCGQPLRGSCLECGKARTDWPDPDRNSKFCSLTCQAHAKYIRQNPDRPRRKGVTK